MTEHENGNMGTPGGSLWTIFRKGGKSEGCTKNECSPMMMELPELPWQALNASIWGMSLPWTLGSSAALGVALILCPTGFNIDIKSQAADIAHLTGALIVTVSVVCMGEVVRIGRYVNVLLATIFAIGPWLVDGVTIAYATTSTVWGAAVFVLAFPRGQVTETYGTWDRFVL